MTTKRQKRRKNLFLVAFFYILSLVGILSYHFLHSSVPRTDSWTAQIHNHAMLPTQQKKAPVPLCLYQGSVMPPSPTFIIGGAQKTGTSSLHMYLSAHPLIVGTLKDESHFFTLTVPWLERRLPENQTSGQAKHCFIRERYISELKNPTAVVSNHTLFSFEKTPSYLYAPEVPQRLREICPWIPKMIFLLRHPVDRAFSQHGMEQKRARTFNHTDRIMPFDDKITQDLKLMETMNMIRRVSTPSSHEGFPNYEPIPRSEWRPDFPEHVNKNLLIRGIYSYQLKHWFNHYPRESILVLDYYKLMLNTTSVYHEILDFVGIPYPPEMPDFSAKKRQSSIHNDAGLSNETRAYLEAFFAPWNAQLESILGEEWKGVWTEEARDF